MIHLTETKRKIEDNTINGDEHISTLFEKVKTIYKSAETDISTDLTFEPELCRIKKEFIVFGDKKGVLFCEKALSIIYEKRGDVASEFNDKINLYEAASDCINEAVIQAEQINWNQPSLFKHQAAIKSKLADALHMAGDHYNANVLEVDAFKIFGKMLIENPYYGQGHLEAATASFTKIKWSLRRILLELRKSESLFDNPKYSRHLPDVKELQRYKHRISEMRSTINLLITITN